jgi:hypothetical protein
VSYPLTQIAPSTVREETRPQTTILDGRKVNTMSTGLAQSGTEMTENERLITERLWATRPLHTCICSVHRNSQVATPLIATDTAKSAISVTESLPFPANTRNIHGSRVMAYR